MGFDAIGSTFTDAADAVGSGISDLGSGIADVGSGIGDALGAGASAIGDGVSSLFSPSTESLGSGLSLGSGASSPSVSLLSGLSGDSLGTGITGGITDYGSSPPVSSSIVNSLLPAGQEAGALASLPTSQSVIPAGLQASLDQSAAPAATLGGSQVSTPSLMQYLSQTPSLSSATPDASMEGFRQDPYASLKELTGGGKASGLGTGYDLGSGLGGNAGGNVAGANTGYDLGSGISGANGGAPGSSSSGFSNLFGDMKLADILKGAGALTSLFGAIQQAQNARKPLSQNAGTVQPGQYFTVGNSLGAPTATTFANRGRSLADSSTRNGFNYAKGGAIPATRGPLTALAPQLIRGEGGGQDDKVPLWGSPGEYIMDADTVSSLGDGSNEAGAKKLDAMRQGIRQHKRSAPATKIPPKAKPPQSYLK